MLGNTLCELASFEWSTYESFQKEEIVLKHTEYDLIVPVFSMAIFKYSAYNASADTNVFGSLFFDILLESYPLFSEYYPLENTQYRLQLPNELIEIYDLYSLPDHKYLVEYLDFQVYSDLKNKQFDTIIQVIKNLEYQYNLDYGQDWKQRYR